MSLKRPKAQGNPELLQDPSTLSGANNICDEGPTAWHYGAAGGLLSDLSPQAWGALPAATLGIFFQSSRREQAAAKYTAAAPLRHHSHRGDSSHHTATPANGETGRVLLWHKDKLSSLTRQKDEAPPSCGMD